MLYHNTIEDFIQKKCMDINITIYVNVTISLKYSIYGIYHLKINRAIEYMSKCFKNRIRSAVESFEP